MKKREAIEAGIAHILLILGIALFISIPFLVWTFNLNN
jgi:hypothetical protein